jgi:methionine sulfoxide reductase heme-binding subunit
VSPILATAGPSAYWYLARGTGAVSLLLLTASVGLGILGSIRFAVAPRWPRFAIEGLHRDVSLLVIVVLVVHILTSVLDSFAPVRLLDAVVPFVSAYRPLWMGLGALAFDVLLALVITSLLRRRLGYRSWRAIHWLAYASWPVALLHGLGTGSDTKAKWMLVLTVACVAVVTVCIWLRVARETKAPPELRAGAYALSVITPLAIAVFTYLGPLQHGWARKAGTPASLLGGAPASVSASGGQVAAGRPAARSQADTLKAPFSARLAGSLTQSQASGGAIVNIALRVSGGAKGQLRVRLGGAQLAGGGLSLTGSQVDLLADGLSSVAQGRVVSLQGQQFVARVADGAGTVMDLRASLNIDSNTGAVTGVLDASPVGQ